MLPTKFHFIWPSGFRWKAFLEIDLSETRIAYGTHPCLLMDQNEMSNSYRGPSIDASYQVSVHLAKLFQRRRFKKVRSAESSFGQKVWVNISHSTESDFVHFPMGHSFDCCLLLNKIKVSLKTVMYYFSTKSLSKYLTATFPTLHFLIASCF
jgi:hypothetical protein